MEGSKHPTVAKEDDPRWPLLVPTQISSSFDFSGSAYYGWEWQFALPMQEGILDATPLEESFTSYSIYKTLDIVEYNPTGTDRDDMYLDFGRGVGVWSELGPLVDSNNKPLLLCNDSFQEFGSGPREEKQIISRRRGSNNRRTREQEMKIAASNNKILTRRTISKYFYMPITEAAKRLNVGLTLLKKRCRELGIQRWPHRKLMSLQTLINNVQELAKVGGDGSEEKLREAIKVLERERKQLEDCPDTQLQTKTKRLRQACFKANYKKRKLTTPVMPPATPLLISASSSSSSSSSSTSSIATLNANTCSEATAALLFHEGNNYINSEDDNDDEDVEEIKSLLCNF